MEVRNMESTVQESEQTVKAKNVNHTSTSEEFSDAQVVESEKIEKKHQTRKLDILSEVFIAFVVIILGVGAFKVTGLYDGMDSTIGRICLGSLLTFYYWVMVRHGWYGKQIQRD